MFLGQLNAAMRRVASWLHVTEMVLSQLLICAMRHQLRMPSNRGRCSSISSLDISIMSISFGSSESQASSQLSDNTTPLWEVQAIMAERTSTTGGVSEVLVVWKPDWIPITNVPDGPVMRQYRDARKCIFIGSVGKVILPVEPESRLESDIVAAAVRMDNAIQVEREREMLGSGGDALSRERGTSRKSLGSVAKRAAPRSLHGTTKK